MGTTFQEFMRIVSAERVLPDTIMACNIHKDTPPEKIHILVEDGVAYITEKT